MTTNASRAPLRLLPNEERLMTAPRPLLVLLPALAAGWLLAGCPKTGVICGDAEVRCNRTCANFQVDPAHCGSCDTQCATGFECRSGACACPGNLTACGQACVDVRSNPSHCGACGQACGAGQACEAGACVTSCSPGAMACSGACIDAKSDRLNCGGCAGSGGVACPQGQLCKAGVCQSDLYAACFNSGEVYALESAGGGVSPTKVMAPPTLPQGLALADKRLFVADLGSDQLLGFDLASGGLSTAAPTVDPIGSGANAVAVDGTFAVVVNSSDATIDLLDLTKPAGQRRTQRVALPAGSLPQYAAISPTDVFVTLQGDTTKDPDPAGNQLARIRRSDGAVKRFTVPTSILQAQNTLPRPQGIVRIGDALWVALANLKRFTAEGPGLVVRYRIPASFDDELVLEQTLRLGDGCLNAGALLHAGGKLWVACGPKYDAQFQAEVPGALAAIDLATNQPAFAPHPLACPEGVSGCREGGATRMAAASGKLFLGDSVDGRLFVFDLATGEPQRDATQPLGICLAQGNSLNFVADVVAVP